MANVCQGPLGREGAPLMECGAFAVQQQSCAVVDAYQNKVSNNPNDSPKGPRQNDHDQWAHTSAAFPLTIHSRQDVG